jgi:hypothetical protein
MSKDEARAFLRSVMGPPRRTLEGEERDTILTVLALIEPFNATNNQHSWTEYYMLGKTEYHVTTFPNEDSIVDQLLEEDGN